MFRRMPLRALVLLPALWATPVRADAVDDLRAASTVVVDTLTYSVAPHFIGVSARAGTAVTPVEITKPEGRLEMSVDASVFRLSGTGQVRFVGTPVRSTAGLAVRWEVTADFDPPARMAISAGPVTSAEIRRIRGTIQTTVTTLPTPEVTETRLTRRRMVVGLALDTSDRAVPNTLAVTSSPADATLTLTALTARAAVLDRIRLESVTVNPATVNLRPGETGTTNVTVRLTQRASAHTVAGGAFEVVLIASDRQFTFPAAPGATPIQATVVSFPAGSQEQTVRLNIPADRGGVYRVTALANGVRKVEPLTVAVRSLVRDPKNDHLRDVLRNPELRLPGGFVDPSPEQKFDLKSLSHLDRKVLDKIRLHEQPAADLKLNAKRPGK